MGYVRFFAETAGSRLSSIALEYMRSLIRIAPVRLVTVTGSLEGHWAMYERLLTTDMTRDMLANVVCTSPEHWYRRLSIPMPKTNPLAQVLATGSEPPAQDLEKAQGAMELYTAGVRNVLIAVDPPRSNDQLLAAIKYEVKITPDLARVAGKGLHPIMVPVPVTSHAAFRNLVVGTAA